jgi:hypothetical protein
MLLGVGPSESQDCMLPACVVNLGQSLTRFLLMGFKHGLSWENLVFKTGAGLFVLLSGVGPKVPPCNVAVLEVVHHSKHT